jgi:hypothetical protein
VGLKPSANQGKARLRGLYRIIYSKTISPHEAHEEGSTYLRTAIIRYAARAVGLMEIENLFRYTALAVGLMEIENLIRYTPRAVGLKPSAMRGEARLRGL